MGVDDALGHNEVHRPPASGLHAPSNLPAVRVNERCVKRCVAIAGADKDSRAIEHRHARDHAANAQLREHFGPASEPIGGEITGVTDALHPASPGLNYNED
jgi:hypothetical protein